MNLENRLILKEPCEQNAVDIFKGTWISKLPENFVSGEVPLFEDTRIIDCVPFLGSVRGKNVLDIGPLEGGQAYVLSQLGAEFVLSIEANTLMYLKCLIVKQIFGLSDVDFILGNVVEFLKNTEYQFDLGMVCGILYHMEDPVQLLWLLSQKCKQLIIWTHYYDEFKNKINIFVDKQVKEFNGKHYEYHRQNYGEVFEAATYCGGVNTFSHWMTKDGILSALEDFGYKNIDIVQDADSPHGAAMLLAVGK